MMRTTTPPRTKLYWRHKTLKAAQSPSRQRNATLSGWFLVLLLAFVLGYLPGILAGRHGQSLLGQQLADYYTTQANFFVWRDLFLVQMAATFLQLSAVLLCGFSAFGSAILFLLFIGKGMFLGFTAANVLAIQGVRALGLYWLTTCLPDLLFLFLSAWLAVYATVLSRGLFQSVFRNGTPRGQLAANARRLLFHFGVFLLLSVVFRFFSSGLIAFLVRLLQR